MGRWKGAASKKRQKSSESVKMFFDTFRQFSRRAKNVKNRQKASKSFWTLFDNFRAAPYFRPLLGGSDSVIFLCAMVHMVEGVGAFKVSPLPRKVARASEHLHKDHLNAHALRMLGSYILTIS